MQPDKVKSKNHTQLIISLGLVGVLVSILGGYIYMGMWWAKQAVVPVVPADVINEEVSEPEASERSKQIMEALEQATETAPAEDQDAIMNALERATTTASEERRAAILEALNNPASLPTESSDGVESQQ